MHLIWSVDNNETIRIIQILLFDWWGAKSFCIVKPSKT